MDSSQGSNFNNILLRDTLGPRNFQQDNESLRSINSTCTGSSIRELSRAEDNGLRSSFRVIPEQPFVHVGDNDLDPDETQTKTVPLQTHTTHSEMETPDYVASTGGRAFFTNGGVKNLDAAALQQNHKRGTESALAKSMREQLKTHERTASNFDYIFDKENNNDDQKQTQEPKNPPTEKTGMCWPKFIGCCIVALVVIAGLVVLLYFKLDSKPSGQRGIITTDDPEGDGKDKPGICTNIEVNLRKEIRFNCSLETLENPMDTLKYVNITPPPYLYAGRQFTVRVSLKESDDAWWAYINDDQYLIVQGPQATCSSGGKYLLRFIDVNNNTMLDSEVSIQVKSEVLRVNVSLNSSQDGNSTDFRIGCSTNSGCEQSFVDFFAEINKEEQFLRGVNFSCTITYNDYDGYSVSCVGNIPDYLMSQFEKITCRPRSKLLDHLDVKELQELEVDIELPDCDLTKHCGYQCKETGDYYVVSEARCDIFHRCYNKQVFTSYCAPGTFFDPGECACRHTKELTWCQDNGALKPNSKPTINAEECRLT